MNLTLKKKKFPNFMRNKQMGPHLIKFSNYLTKLLIMLNLSTQIKKIIQ